MHPLAPYRSPEARDDAFAALAARLGAAPVTLGRSVAGRPILAYRIGQGDTRLLVVANIHGIELIATETALAFAEAFATPSKSAQALLDVAELWIVPSANPDGYARTWNANGQGRLSTLRANDHGVDLNRNFPLPKPTPWYAPSLGGWATGSADPTSPFFRGTRPLCEPETQALARLFAEQRFHASLSLHSMMGTLIPAHVEDRAAATTYQSLCRAFQAAQPHTRYRRVQSRVFDWFTGEQEDHQHHAHGTWACVVECFPLWASYRQHLRPPCLFWRFNPKDLRRSVDNDVPGMLAYFHAALALPRNKA